MRARSKTVASSFRKCSSGLHKGPTYGQLALYIFASTIYLIAEKKCHRAPLCVIFGHISQFWRYHHDEPLLNFSHLMHNIGDQYHWFWVSQYHFNCVRKLQSPGFDLNLLAKSGLFAPVTIYAGMHFDLQRSLSKSSMTPGDAKYEFFVHF